MKVSHLRRTVFVGSIIFLLACGSDEANSPDPPPPPPPPQAETHGWLRITVATVGSNLDADGYGLAVTLVNQAIPPDSMVTSIPSSGTRVWHLNPAEYVVRLFGGIATNCTLDGENPRMATVIVGATAEVSFQVTCVVPPPLEALHNQIVFVSTRDRPPSFNSYSEDLIVMNADGSNPVNLTNTPFVDETAPAISPDGKRIAFQTWTIIDGYLPVYQSNLFVMEVNGLNRTELVVEPRGTDPTGPKWSPDGQRILFADTSGIGVVNVDGTGQVMLTRAPDVQATWSPDGSKIAFVRWNNVATSSSMSSIFVMNADGSNPVNVMRVGVWVMGLAWSPDGSRLAYASGTHQRYLTVMNADGSGAETLRMDPTDIYEDDGSPEWSPDGTKLAFTCHPPTDVRRNYEICVMSLDGSLRANLTNHPADEWGPSWAK